MNEQDDLLLRQFFSEHSFPTIADNGFSDRVIHRLPPRRSWLQRLWTPFCIAVFAVLFVVFDGWSLILERLLQHAVHLCLYVAHLHQYADYLYQYADHLLHAPFPFSITSMAVILFSLLLIGISEAVFYERRAL